jgi:hypothetical protein
MPRRFKPPPETDSSVGDAQAKPTKTRAKGARLSTLDRYQILALHRQRPDLSYRELGALCSCTPSTAREVCLMAGKDAQEIMSAQAGPMLDAWLTAALVAASRGDHRPAKEWLLHGGTLEQLPDVARSTGPAVVIINSPLPGMPGAAIEVRAALPPPADDKT